jgi:hypothetical protein
LRGLVKTKV